MNSEYNYKWAIILGGSSGLGLASAIKLSSHGMNICIVHRDRKTDLVNFDTEIEAMKSLGVKVKTFNKDVLKPGTITEVIDALDKNSVKVLLHSIAKGSVKPLISDNNDELTNEDFMITINAMALSWIDWTKGLIAANRFSKGARNIAFTSEGNTKALKYYGAVSAAKATLDSLMRQMAVEFAPLGITTNCIQAGVTRTSSFDRIPGSDQIAKYTKQRNPFQRLTAPNDVANVVYLLSKNEAQWINGTIIKVDGGESLR
jgi:enoyl-[acyl-carrier protein] reductase III